MDTEFIFKKERNLLNRKRTITLIYGFCKRTNMLYVMELILMWMPMKGGQYSEWDEEKAICLYSVNSVIVPV